MLKRRDFLRHSAATAGTALLGSAPAGAARSAKVSHSGLPFDAVIVDARYSDSRRFAQVLQQRGARLIDSGDDLGRLWQGALGSAFGGGARRIAGLTSWSDLFVCESIAREHGARLVYEGMHDCRGSRLLTHSLRLGDRLAGLGAELRGRGAQWPLALAQRLALAQPQQGPLQQESVPTRARRNGDHPGTLFSWVLA